MRAAQLSSARLQTWMKIGITTLARVLACHGHASAPSREQPPSRSSRAPTLSHLPDWTFNTDQSPYLDNVAPPSYSLTR